jgi:hypothetical protein
MHAKSALRSPDSKVSRWLAAGLAFVAATPWVLLAVGAPTSLLVWIPAATIAASFAAAFLVTAAAALLGRGRTDLLLIGLTVLSLVTLLYAPALALGGPAQDAPESVVCPPGTAICWNYLHSAFKVHAAVLVAGLLLVARTRIIGRASVA